MTITISRALTVEAPALSAVLIDSITRLCAADHGNDPDKIAGWIENKTPGHVAGWIDAGRSQILTARLDDDIAGVGGFFAHGEINLNYVAPWARGRGVSHALLADIESRLIAAGNDRGRLTSTRTAHQFYLSRGWRDDGPTVIARGGEGQPMVKDLRPG